MAGLMVSCMGMEESDPSSLKMPQVKTFEVKDNGSLVFELKASVDKNLAGRVAECGFYYGKDKNLSDANKIECKMLGGSFSADVTLHEYGETFYACSYISNGIEGNEICSDPKKIAVKELGDYVAFGEAAVVSYDRTAKVATVSISYEVKNGVEVTAGGLCYGPSKDLSVNGNHLTDPDFSSGSATYEIPEIETGKTYYVRPYLYDGDELTYGEVSELRIYAVPVVETADVTEVTDVSAVCGGNVTDNGGAEITAKGIVWSTSPNPTVSLSTKADAGKGAGEFSSTMTNLIYSTKYYVRAYATNSAGTSYGEAKEFVTAKWTLSNVPDLSSAGTANCYIVSKAGLNRFLSVKGNSDVPVGEVESVEVLWESFGTSSSIEVGDLIKHVFYEDSYVIFQTADTFKEGNAIVAAKDVSGTILWSWHIWMTDEPAKCMYVNNYRTMMDRNLGATSATPDDVGALGLLYQWGRKDPFLGSSSISSRVETKSTLAWPTPMSSSASHGTIDYAVEHPTTFITSTTDNRDWYYTGSSSTDNTRWQSTKTIYDPCPAGWRVPDGGDDGIWTTAGLDDYNCDTAYAGMLFGADVSSPPTWYPFAGFKDDYFTWIMGVGEYSYYWSVTPNDVDVYSLSIQNDGSVNPSFFGNRAVGLSVRCLQE